MAHGVRVREVEVQALDAARLEPLMASSEHGEQGLLIDDPRDLAAFGAAVESLVARSR